jgi:LacI family transcriptional regulator
MAFDNFTLKDMARELKLSPSTISRALRDSYEISPATKKIVVAYAKKINYRPNQVARGLKERKSNTIGIIVSEISNSFFSQIIEGVEHVANSKNYQVVISQTLESYERECKNLDLLYAHAADGLLMTLSSETNDLEHLLALTKKNFPIVFFDRVPEEIQAHKVISDNKTGSFEAVQYLANMGKKKIAHLGASQKLSNTKQRHEGYKMGLSANGLSCSPVLAQFCEYGGLYKDEIHHAIDQIAEIGFDAIFISGDKLTTGYLQCLKERPALKLENIPIAGFTNSNLVNIFSPTITTIRQPAFDMGRKAAELLIRQIESKSMIYEYETIVLSTALNGIALTEI